MSISPLDVRNQVFKKKFRGYDGDEVRIFLDAVADRMEDMIKDKEDLERENIELKEKSQAFMKIETALRDSMVTAQRICDESRVNAQKEADSIRREAQLDAQAKLAEANRQIEDLARYRDNTRAETTAFIAKLRSLLEGHLSFLGSIESEVRSENRMRDVRAGERWVGAANRPGQDRGLGAGQGTDAKDQRVVQAVMQQVSQEAGGTAHAAAQGVGHQAGERVGAADRVAVKGGGEGQGTDEGPGGEPGTGRAEATGDETGHDAGEDPGHGAGQDRTEAEVQDTGQEAGHEVGQDVGQDVRH